jgi:hypothetical protein
VCGLIQFWTTEIQVRISSMKSTPINFSVLLLSEAAQHPKAQEHDKPYKRKSAGSATQPFDTSKKWA